WAEVATPLSGTTLVGGPQATVTGALATTGNWLYDTFNNPFAVGGHEGNFPSYVNTLTIPAGASRSVLPYVVRGQRVTTATSAAERLKVESTATTLAATPDVTGLTPAQICSIDNFTLPCTTTDAIPRIPAPAPVRAVTTSGYDVVEKTI